MNKARPTAVKYYTTTCTGAIFFFCRLGGRARHNSVQASSLARPCEIVLRATPLAYQKKNRPSASGGVVWAVGVNQISCTMHIVIDKKNDTTSWLWIQISIFEISKKSVLKCRHYITYSWMINAFDMSCCMLCVFTNVYTVTVVLCILFNALLSTLSSSPFIFQVLNQLTCILLF